MQAALLRLCDRPMATGDLGAPPLHQGGRSALSLRLAMIYDGYTGKEERYVERLLSEVLEVAELFFGKRVKWTMGCRKRMPCSCCRKREGCIEAYWDSIVIVWPCGRHEYKRSGSHGSQV